jgi:hypothetical protein
VASTSCRAGISQCEGLGLPSTSSTAVINVAGVQ